MKKKNSGNSKLIFTITLFFVVCCLMATGSWAARRVDFTSANSTNFIGPLNQNGAGMNQVFGLSRGDDFKLLKQRTDLNGVTHYRYQQVYKGFPVWGLHTIISRSPSNRVVGIHGSIVQEIAGDITTIPPVSSLDPAGALTPRKTLHKKRNIGAEWHFRNEQYGTYIYVDKNDRAHLCYVVSFFADTSCGDPSRFIHFIEVNTGSVLQSFDMLAYADGVGPGGNLKVGYYYYGADYPPFPVTEENGTCYMETTELKSVDLNHGTTGTTPHSFTCYENTYKPINGGICPLNDAQALGKQVINMYNSWYGVPVLPFQLVLRCHYSVDYEGWFWDGSSITFGDGDVIFFPPVAIDIIGHEASHGFTEYNSGLINNGQSGGINESFSDMAGQAAEYYLKGTTDFAVGPEICKTCGILKHLYDPPLDGHSIDHIDDFYEGMPVEYSSGIFNKVFFLISTSNGWQVRMAFDIFVKANQDYWQPDTTFQQGAEAARDAALDLGYSCEDVKSAFAVVGINIACPSPCPGVITNPGFETGTTSGWTEAGDVSITTDSHTGKYGVSLNGANSSVEQVITDLCGSTTYIVSCWGKAKDPAGVYLGVKDYGGDFITVKFTNSKEFVKQSITFTTGPTNTSATILFIKLDSKFTGIGDDFEIF